MHNIQHKPYKTKKERKRKKKKEKENQPSFLAVGQKG